MASKFFTKTGEENFINTLIKNGLNIDIPKYYILRLAINKSFRLKYYPLDNGIWAKTITHDGSGKNEKEYNYEQLIGLGKNSKNDYANILRAMFAFRHKDENLDFSDDSVFENTVEKYIHRGLLEIYNTYKSSDDFYQWLIDDFELTILPDTSEPEPSGAELTQDDLKEHFEKENLSVEILSFESSIRHDICKIRMNSEKDLKKLQNDISNFKFKFGLLSDAIFETIIGEAMSANILLPRPKDSWKKLDKQDFKKDLQSYKKAHYISAYCGRDIKNEPFFFDLESCPHIFVAGTTGSGKSVLLHNLIVSIANLNSNTKFVMIDPKGGAEFGFYNGILNLSEFGDNKVVDDIEEVENVLDKIIEEMERRNKICKENGVQKNKELKNPFENIIVVVDEVADLFMQIKEAEDKMTRLAQKGRSAGIFLILATQTPNSQIFSQTLRANIPARVALKTISSTQSKVIMDEVGAENLLGKGDLYAKIDGKKVMVFAPFLDKTSIKEILS